MGNNVHCIKTIVCPAPKSFYKNASQFIIWEPVKKIVAWDFMIHSHLKSNIFSNTEAAVSKQMIKYDEKKFLLIVCFRIHI